ncbi:DNA polymerase III subunit gamma/tau [Gracilinema caldarium]|uniref:DNA polymerase III subunit gamma/tau n=1 Tax=Gracilinema caldarium (strain ATCC 51460 / DSM 7334 / H1) TaxID=744872 RepID=F8EYD9_GRAC1|nr:DNA polymerase III subunit gamma/tau [Gracilinema caldarium]AEJ18371.1 DNA polymerase III, subunits gamma and tau [Gracilinema caldarium DSM 7334]
MAYEVTATRRRPKTFDEMAGQEFVVATLKSSIETGRIAHAYLFSGPRGCGKTSTARILARSLNCEKGPTATPCGVCTNCVEIARGASLDVIEIDGASNTSVNDVRQIKDEVLFPPNSGRYKVYIIDEVHMLSNSAFNALLKTIEEPPPYIVFIFATTELHKVPATIKSRCQQFAFRLIPIETIKAILADACRELGVRAEDEALFWIAKESTGSLRDAYTLFDQVVAFSEGYIRTELIREKLGLVGLDAINRLAEACVQEQAAEALLQLDNILGQGVSIEQLVIDLAEYFRSILLLKQGIKREALLGYSAERYSSTVVASLSVQQIEQALSILLGVYRDIRYSLSPRFELETAISKLSWLRRWIAPLELKEAVEHLRSSILNPTNGAPHRTAASMALKAAAQEAPAIHHESRGPTVTDLPEQPPSLTEGFKQFLAAKASQAVSTDPSRSREKIKELIGDPTTSQANTSVSVQSHASSSTSESIASPIPALAHEPAPAPHQSSSPEPVRTLAPEHLESLRLELINLLKKERGMLASGLEKTADWKLDPDGHSSFDGSSGRTLIIPTRDSLSADLLKKEKHSISGTLHQMGYPQLQIEITLAEPKDAQNSPQGGTDQIPPAVEMVRKLFRGTIVRTK